MKPPEIDKEPTRIDAEWELAKSNRRYLDLMEEIEKLRQDMRSVNAKIARLKMEVRHQEGEEPEGREDNWPQYAPAGPDLDELTDVEILKLYEAVKERGLLE